MAVGTAVATSRWLVGRRADKAGALSLRGAPLVATRLPPCGCPARPLDKAGALSLRERGRCLLLSPSIFSRHGRSRHPPPRRRLHPAGDEGATALPRRLPCGGWDRPAGADARPPWTAQPSAKGMLSGRGLSGRRLKPFAFGSGPPRLSRTAEVAEPGFPCLSAPAARGKRVCGLFPRGGCVHRPRGTGRRKPPVPARRWAAGPPQRPEWGKARILFLSGSAEPSGSARGGEGRGLRPARAPSGPKAFAEGGTVRRTAPPPHRRSLDAEMAPRHRRASSALHCGGRAAAPRALSLRGEERLGFRGAGPRGRDDPASGLCRNPAPGTRNQPRSREAPAL